MNYESFGICQTVGRYGIFEPYFFIKKVWTKNFRIGRSDIDVSCIKMNEPPSLINISATMYRIFKQFFLLKTEIHSQIFNTNPFLCKIFTERNEVLKQINSYSYCLIVASKQQNLYQALPTGPRRAQAAPKWLLVGQAGWQKIFHFVGTKIPCPIFRPKQRDSRASWGFIKSNF